LREKKADIGDYMKVFACTAVMMQTVFSIVLRTEPTKNYQILIGLVGCCCCFSSAYSGLAYNVVFVSGVQSRGFSDPSTSIYPSVLFQRLFPSR